MAFLRLIGSLVGFLFGFFLGVELLQVTRVTPVSNQVLVVFLLATLCAIVGWLGVPYVTVLPSRWVVARIHDASTADLLGGAFGAILGLLLAMLASLPLALLPGELGRFGPFVVAMAFGALGTVAGFMKRHELARWIREMRMGRQPVTEGRDAVLVDTSVIIDGRIAGIVRTGFVHGRLIVPRFILHELQLFADSSDPMRRERGRRGLEVLQSMQAEQGVTVDLTDDDPPMAGGADAKLVQVARALGVPIMTNDYGLDRVAGLQGVRVLNVNDLAKVVRAVVLPGEELALKLTQEGREPGQGVGYLEDGTMIVVENGVRWVGSEVTVQVLRVLQTAGGRLVFAQPKGDPSEVRRPRAVSPGA